MLRSFYRILSEIRWEWEEAPESEYRQGGLDVLDLVEADVYNELGEPDE